MGREKKNKQIKKSDSSNVRLVKFMALTSKIPPPQVINLKVIKCTISKWLLLMQQEFLKTGDPRKENTSFL